MNFISFFWLVWAGVALILSPLAWIYHGEAVAAFPIFCFLSFLGLFLSARKRRDEEPTMAGIANEWSTFMGEIFIVFSFLLVLGIVFIQPYIQEGKWRPALIQMSIVGIAMGSFAFVSFSRVMDDPHFRRFFWGAWLLGFIALGAFGFGNIAWLALIAIPPLLSMDWQKS